ncbi:FAD-dependent monooxygenase [Patulibacter minatonensis]|uniref:FAD-dependent monooxygenase n=1 Tax=Patulibacter minatonensis TaxID=298163 RepID=UPI0004B4C97F|nr:FAD-dependent monooxygenase [Patulibacter minatonensis]
MRVPDPAPVVVAGLGPVGATLALLLARQGVPVLAVEREHEVFPHPRAVALDDGALRVLQAAGALDPPGFPLHAGGPVRIAGPTGRTLVELPPPPADGGHPALSFFRQPELEGRLRALLDAEPLVEVLLRHEVVGVRDEDGHAVVRLVRRSDDRTSSVRSSWVLACDGGRSGIRRDRGLRLVGRTSGHRWLVVDGTTPPGTDPAFTFVCDPRRPWVHGPLPGGRHRWEFLLTAEEGRDGSPEDLASRLLGERVPGGGPAVARASVYVFHARIAPRLRAGRVLLAGDAAHLAPPFAGQGLGAGLRDVHNLAWKIAAVEQDGRPERLLRSYARERLPHVLTTTALAVGLGALVQVRRGRAARVRDAVLTRLAGSARVQAWIRAGGWRPPGRVGGTLVAGRADHRAGLPLPQPDVVTPDGRTVPLDALLGAGWAVVIVDDVGAAGTTSSATGPVSRRPASPAAPVVVQLGPSGTADDDGVLRAWLAPASAALVRPDRVVFGTTDAAGLPDLCLRADRALGVPRDRRRTPGAPCSGRGAAASVGAAGTGPPDSGTTPPTGEPTPGT